MRIILATNNKNKLREFRDIFSDKYIITSLSELNINIDPEENGSTFKDNAYIKAKAIKDYMIENHILKDDDIIISDDSGFEIDALNGEPGIYSARYLGDVSYEYRFKHILELLHGKKDKERSCHFTCVICKLQGNVSSDDDKNKAEFFEGKVNGEVAEDIKGINGFGYDPIFYIKEKNKTMAELTEDEKNQISHRAFAIEKLKNALK